MKEKIKQYFSNIWVYPALWIITGLLGSIQRMYSPLYDQYLMEATKDVDAPASFMVALGTFPPVVFFMECVVVIFYSGVYVGFHKLLKKRLPKLVKYIIVLTAILSWGYICAVSINDTLIMSIKYGFYILTLQDVIWFTYTVFVVSRFWKLIHGISIK